MAASKDEAVIRPEAVFRFPLQNIWLQNDCGEICLLTQTTCNYPILKTDYKDFAAVDIHWRNKRLNNVSAEAVSLRCLFLLGKVSHSGS